MRKLRIEKTKIKEKLVAVVMVAIMLISCFSNPVEVQAKMKTVKVSSAVLEAGKQYTLVDMPYNGPYSPLPRSYNGKKFTERSIQNFQETPDGKYVFTVAEGITGDLKTGAINTVLSRCQLPETRGKSAKAKCVQAHKLEVFGHSDVLAVYQPDLEVETYLLFVADSSSKSDKGYGTEIVRLTYEVDEEGNGTITRSVKLTNFIKTKIYKKNGKYKVTKQGDSIKRLSCTVNQNDNLIAFRIACKNGNVNYTVYQLSELNEQLDLVAEDANYDMYTAAKFNVANVFFTSTPSKSFQSLGIDGKYLYLLGGYPGKDTVIYKLPYITYEAGKVRMQNIHPTKLKKYVKQKIVVETNLKICGKKFTKKQLEVEGLMVKYNPDTKKVEYYMNFRSPNTSIRSGMSIYKIEVK